MASSEETIAALRNEIEQLRRELDLTSTEKMQSAQYGLALLEEKSSLQQRFYDIEALYETTKHELDITQEVPADYVHIFLSFFSSKKDQKRLQYFVNFYKELIVLSVYCLHIVNI